MTTTIFDLDGLLLDTERVYDAVIQRYARHMTGQEIEQGKFENMRAQMFGRKSIESARLLHQTLNLSDDTPPEHYLEWRTSIMKEEFPKADLLPGARKLLLHLATHKVPMALATSSQAWMIDLKFHRYPELKATFGKNIITADDVTHGKPHPEMFLAAADMLSAKPEDTLVFEDAPSGVEAAKAGGMPVIAVPHPLLKGMPQQWAVIEQADQVLNSLEEFNPGEWGLPSYQ